MNTAELTGAEGFAAFCQGLSLRHFSAKELLFMGDSHANPKSKGYGLNTYPPPELWQNIIPAITALDRLREASGAPVILLSLYRSEAYNAAIGGAQKSQHKRFCAIDFKSMAWSPSECFEWLKRDRALGGFMGGLGAYKSFTHIDGRGTTATWGTP